MAKFLSSGMGGGTMACQGSGSPRACNSALNWFKACRPRQFSMAKSNATSVARQKKRNSSTRRARQRNGRDEEGPALVSMSGGEESSCMRLCGERLLRNVAAPPRNKWRWVFGNGSEVQHLNQ